MSDFIPGNEFVPPEAEYSETQFYGEGEAEPDPQPARPDLQRFVIRDAAFAMQDRPPREWLVDGLIEPMTVNTIYGDPGSKKTYSMLHLAVCVALGIPWLRYYTKQTPVLFINEETNEIELADRLKLVLAGLDANEDTPIYCMSLAQLHMDKRDDAAELFRIVKRYGFRLIIIDALSEIMTGDENSKQDLLPVYSYLLKIAGALDTSFIIIHHPNKTGQTYRGSSIIKGSSSLLLKVTSDEDNGDMVFKTEKNRNGRPQKWAAEASWHDDQFTLVRGEYVPQGETFSDSETHVIRFLQNNGVTEIDEIASHAEICTPGAARKAVYKLAKRDIVYRTNPGGRGTGALYDLKQEYKEHAK